MFSTTSKTNGKPIDFRLMTVSSRKGRWLHPPLVCRWCHFLERHMFYEKNRMNKKTETNGNTSTLTFNHYPIFQTWNNKGIWKSFFQGDLAEKFSLNFPASHLILTKSYYEQRGSFFITSQIFLEILFQIRCFVGRLNFTAMVFPFDEFTLRGYLRLIQEFERQHEKVILYLLFRKLLKNIFKGVCPSIVIMTQKWNWWIVSCLWWCTTLIFRKQKSHSKMKYPWMVQNTLFNNFTLWTCRVNLH